MLKINASVLGGSTRWCLLMVMVRIYVKFIVGSTSKGVSCEWATKINLVMAHPVLFYLNWFVISNSSLDSLLVSGHNATLAQYFLNDTRCEAWIENLDNETERCVITHRTMYCFGDLDFPRMEIRLGRDSGIQSTVLLKLHFSFQYYPNETDRKPVHLWLLADCLRRQ